MKTLRYEKIIAASQEKIWDVLWNGRTYPEWTKPFSPESIMTSDWQVGGKTYFLDGKSCGMVSTISTLEPPNTLIFTHLGFVENGIEDLTSPQVQKMSGAQERYFLQSYDADHVQLIVEVQVDEEWQQMMDNGFAEGLEIVKTLAE